MIKDISKRLGCTAATLMALAAVALATPTVGMAAEGEHGPKFAVDVNTPDYAKAGESVSIIVDVINVGDENSHGSIVIADTADPEMETPSEGTIFTPFNYSVLNAQTSEEELHYPECETTGQTYTCTIVGGIPPGGHMLLRFGSAVSGGANGVVTNRVSVRAADVAAQESQQQIKVGEAGPFSIGSLTAPLLDATGQPENGAGATPEDFATKLHFTSVAGKYLTLINTSEPVEHYRNVTVHLPVGLVGNPTAVPVCTAEDLALKRPSSFSNNVEAPACPLDSVVGQVHIWLGGGLDTIVPLYNMVAPPGSAAQLGFNVLETIVTLNARLRSGDHGIDVFSSNTSTTIPATDVEVIVWGNPLASTHDRERGECGLFGAGGASGYSCPVQDEEKSFLRTPTSCSGQPLSFGAEANSYEHSETYVTASYLGATMDGCELLPFSPTIATQPTATAANSPTGVAVRVSLPQSSSPQGAAEADLKEAVVTLPEGMALNPSAADGLQACGDARFKATEAGVSECPDSSKVGTVLLQTPLLETPVEGSVYVLSQESSDPESGEMFRLGMELRDDRHGIDIKVVGNIDVNKTTGRLTTTFDNTPQLPFNDITLRFKSGARAPLTTPFSCQAQTTEADLYSWAEPSVAVHRNMTFQLTSGPEGTPCIATPGFNPGFNAGVSSVQAGAFTPFLTTFSRKDVDQSMQRVSVKLPKGLLGSLVGLPLCAEAQANAGTCSQASEIGSVTAGAGAGPTPFYVTGGHVYMTQGYKGAPFGLSVVVPAKAGPFDLGTVVVRAKVDVDVHTAQLTVTTDPLPQIVGGVPVNLRLVNVTIDRPNFTYNPTNCDPSEVSGTVTGGQGATAQVANHFQVTNCGALSFKPKFRVSTPGKTSRKIGAGLTAKLSYPRGPQGTQANIAKVKVSLPKQLPSRLTTLQKACLAATFESNPAACPAASRIGTAKASTPVLPVPLSGPVYFVSHGGEAFPDLVIVLQGYGVTIELVGNTFISKAGITSTTFKQIPDVPVGSFELHLPQGPNSALAANSNLCKAKLKMPTIFVGQDGAEIKTNTPITATGCAKHKAVKHKKHKKTKHKKKK